MAALRRTARMVLDLMGAAFIAPPVLAWFFACVQENFRETRTSDIPSTTAGSQELNGD